MKYRPAELYHENEIFHWHEIQIGKRSSSAFILCRKTPNFDLCPVLPGFAKLTHIQPMDFKHFDIVCIQPYQVHVLLDDQIFPLPTIPCSVQIDQWNTAWWFVGSAGRNPATCWSSLHGCDDGSLLAQWNLQLCTERNKKAQSVMIQKIRKILQ